ncbi:MAG: LuxR C-terminal-related transcriptional regulator [Lachnospiraceae bacterium]|nr:LuxR C-terminal-related transcriptional regulator [Lachnospiraceae bacterium]
MKLLKERKTPPAVEEKPAKNEQETLENYINTLAREKSLTDREADVLREYLSGKNRTEISQTLFISESTVKNHISNIFSKLGVKNKNELLQMLNAH